jgi:hypothetical protein
MNLVQQFPTRRGAVFIYRRYDCPDLSLLNPVDVKFVIAPG